MFLWKAEHVCTKSEIKCKYGDFPNHCHPTVLCLMFFFGGGGEHQNKNKNISVKSVSLTKWTK